LVGRQQELLAVPKLVDDLLARRRGCCRVGLHEPGFSRRRSSLMRITRSALGSYSKASVGVCLSRRREATRDWRYPCEDDNPASDSSRSLSSPSTLTKTRARRRSGLVSTAVTVTNPTRGSFSSVAIASLNTSRMASLTLRILSLGM